jgi:hypothetical protein
MMYSLSPTAQDIVAGSSVAAKLHPNPKHLPYGRELYLTGKV